MPIIFTIFTLLIGIPIVVILTYAMGLLVPASHIVSRSSTFKVSSKRLWQILTEVSKYPQWQPKVEKVVIEESADKKDDIKETVFVEYSTRKRHTVIIHHERVENQCLLRILEERPAAKAPAPTKVPTFSGSWTFDITEENNKENGEEQVTLKITEQGVIKKPLVRVTHLLLFGFHSRIDRFMNDLHKKIDADNQDVPFVTEKEEPVKSLDVEEEDTKLEESQNQQQPFYSTVLNPPQPSQEDEHSSGNNTSVSTAAIATTDQSQVIDDHLMTESKIVDKEWDLMSEIYERAPPAATTAQIKTEEQEATIH